MPADFALNLEQSTYNTCTTLTQDTIKEYLYGIIERECVEHNVNV